jgi:hypothetical protein
MAMLNSCCCGGGIQASTFITINTEFPAGIIFPARAAVMLAARLPRAEGMMIEPCGDECREAAKKTGRVLPKW